jgi:hypothetical protein
MDKKTYRSVLAILAYLMPEEKRHWEEAGRPKDHIYLHVKRLDDWCTEVAKDYQDN